MKPRTKKQKKKERKKYKNASIWKSRVELL